MYHLAFDKKQVAKTVGNAATFGSIGQLLPAVPTLQAKLSSEGHKIQKKENNTGLPNHLKSGIENVSGFSLNDVKVHYNSDKPTQLQAHAFAQGTDIHVAPGQEKHLPHEAWHVVQQKQGRVQATMQMKQGVPINDDKGLENEADVMGAKSLQFSSNDNELPKQLKENGYNGNAIQRLALQYGNGAPIPADARKIAAAQNAERGVDISVQTVPTIAKDAYTKMKSGEKIYIVAHGRAPIGNEPAVLQEGNGDVLSGSEVAGIVNEIRMGLAEQNKSIGEVKIEACMSSLGRKTKSGMFGEKFINEKPSLIADIKASLQSTYKVSGITLQGNLGFSSGNDFEEGGITNLSPKNTELGLLAAVLETLYDVGDADWSNAKNTAIKKDGLNIIRKFGSDLATFDQTSVIKDLITGSSAALIKTYLNGKNQSVALKEEMMNIVSVLGGYIRTTTN